MKKYYITRMTNEIKKASDFKPGCTFAPDVNPERIEEYDTEEDAKRALSERFTDITRYHHVITYWLIEEYWLEVVEFDDDGEEIDSEKPEVSEPKYWYAVWDEDMGNDWSNGSWVREEALNLMEEGKMFLKIDDRNKAVVEETSWEEM